MKVTEWLRHRLPPCIRITEQLSEAFDRDLSAAEKLLVWMHIRLCIHCRRFSRQLDLISRAMENARNEARLMSASKIPPLSYTAREKIKSAIRSGVL